MSRYIDADKLEKDGWSLQRNVTYLTAESGYGYVETMRPTNFPAADVVKVVRCKDCIHYMPYDWMFSEVRRSENIEDYPQNEIGCEWIDHHINPEGYCSYGERKDE